FPSKESIREIRINQNPFAPEYDKLGFGRIEVFTKPGTDKFKGSVYFNFANQFWNTRNPYAAQKAPFLLKEYGGSVSGAINKRASFFLDVRRDEVDNGSIINAITLDPQTLAIINPFTDVFKTRQRRFGILWSKRSQRFESGDPSARLIQWRRRASRPFVRRTKQL